MYKKRTISLSLGSHFLMNLALGPLVLPLYLRTLKEKTKYASLLGFGLWIVLFGSSMGTFFLVKQFNRGPVLGEFLTRDDLVAEFFFFSAPLLGFVMISVSVSRWSRIPASDRTTASFFFAVWLQFRRALWQYARDVTGIFLDLVLAFFTGTMVGILSLGKKWTPPLSETSAWAANATKCLGCQQNDASIPTRIEAMCKVLNLSSELYASLSLMVSMGIALLAVMSSQRLFSAHSVWRRESRSGMSTEAMYFGRSLLHLLVSLVATMLFSLPFFFLVQPHGMFGSLFGLFLLLHVCFSGLGMYCSILLSPALSGLMSVLGVLSFVLFSGSLFVYGVAMPPLTMALPWALWVISLVSPIRWAYELFFLLMMNPFREFLSDPNLGYAYVLYGFSYEHSTTGWLAIGLVALLLRVLPYLALVAKEK